MKSKGLSRIAIALSVFALWAVAIAARLYQLQIVEHDDFKKRAERQQQRVLELDPPRGTIYDVAGRELAVSVEVESLAAVPREIRDPAAAARALARLLDLDVAKLTRQLTSDREFVWVARKLDPPVVDKVRGLGLKGLRFLPESKRYYPMRELAAQVASSMEELLRPDSSWHVVRRKGGGLLWLTEIDGRSVRSTREPVRAEVRAFEDGAEVELLTHEEGVAPGQACVLYDIDGSRMLGGGWIVKGEAALAA